MGLLFLKIKFSIDQSDVDLFVIIAEVDSSGNINVLSHPGKMRAPFMDNKKISLQLSRVNIIMQQLVYFQLSHQFKKETFAVIIRRRLVSALYPETGHNRPSEQQFDNQKCKS